MVPTDPRLLTFAMATMLSSPPINASTANIPLPRAADDVPSKPRGSKRRKAKAKTVEELYSDLIKAGIVRIERRKGKPPLIVWL